jgi:hypothetical protein
MLFVMIAGVLLNVVGNYLLIHGHYGFPKLGLNGAAYSTLGARTFMAVVMTFCTSAVAWESRDWMMSNDYHRTTVSGIVTWSDTSDAQMKRYEQGLVVVGKNYANSPTATYTSNAKWRCCASR